MDEAKERDERWWGSAATATGSGSTQRGRGVTEKRRRERGANKLLRERDKTHYKAPSRERAMDGLVVVQILTEHVAVQFCCAVASRGRREDTGVYARRRAGWVGACVEMAR